MPAPEKPPPTGSLLPLSMAGCLAVLASVVLLFLTLGFAGVALATVGVLFAVVAFHYLVWGRWLSQSIRDEVEAEERLAAAKSPTALPPVGDSRGE